MPARTAVTVWLPEPAALGARPIVCFGFPGGGYSRRYFDFDMPGAAGGGEAGWHTQRGWIFVACDHLGVGESTVIDPDTLDYETIVRANDATVAAVVGQLEAGDVSPDFPAISDPLTLGIGQSMGGCFTIVQQARHRSFDAIGILGYSAIHTVVRTRPGAVGMPMPWITRDSDLASPLILNPEMLVPPSEPPADAPPPSEHPWTWAFHFEDVPADVVAADMVPATPLPAWRSATVPACAIKMVAPGNVATEAASITVPVLVAAGERDVVLDPWAEPRAYMSCRDITLVVLPAMAHMHNFAGTREHMWRRIHTWGQGVAQSRLP